MLPFTKNIRGKIVVYVYASMIIVFGTVLFIYISGTYNNLKNDAEQILRLHVLYVGEEINKDNSEVVTFVRTLARLQTEDGLFGQRNRSIRIIRNQLAANPNFTNMYFVYEPDADGNDAEYARSGDADTAAIDASGRFLTTWVRQPGMSDSLRLQKALDMETSLYYQGLKVRIQSNNQETYIPPSLAISKYYQRRRHLDRASPAPAYMISEPYIYEGKYMIEYTCPILIDGVFKGIAGADRTLESIANLMNHRKRHFTEDFILVSRFGRIIASTVDTIKATSTIEETPYEHILAGIFTGDLTDSIDVVVHRDPVDGKEYYFTASHIDYGDWRLVSRVSVSEIMGPVQAQVTVALLIAFVGMIGMFPVLAWIAKSISKPIFIARSIAEEVTRGNLAAPIPAFSKGDDTGEVIEALTRMRDSVRDLIGTKELVAHISSRFASAEYNEIDAVIASAIEEVSVFIGADRCYLIEFIPDTDNLVFSHCWDRSSKPVVFQLNVPYSRQFSPKLANDIAEGKIVSYRITDLIAEAKVVQLERIRAAEIKSVILVPLKLSSESSGALLFESMDEQVSWDDSHHGFLEVVGHIFLNGIERRNKTRSILEINAELERRVMLRTQELSAANKSFEEFQALLKSLSAKFVRVDQGDINENITVALGEVSSFIGAERALLLQVFPDKGTFLFSHRWDATTAPVVVEMNLEYDRTFIPYLHSELIAGNFVMLASEDSLPPGAVNERAIIEKVGIQSLVILPLRIMDAVYGAIMFATINKRVEWTGPQLEILQVTGQVFLNALYRQRDELAMRDLNIALEKRVEERTAALLIANRELDSFRKLISSLSTQFITAHDKDLGPSIVEALAEVSRFIGADRAYLCQYYTERRTMEFLYRYDVSEAATIIQLNKEYSSEFVPYTYEQMLQGKFFYAYSAEELPAEAPVEKKLMQAVGIKSFVSIPLHSSDGIVGTLLFHTMNEHRRWTQQQFELLQTIGYAFINALIRQKHDKYIRELNADLEHRVETRTAELQQLNHELEAFSYSVSHDLRTPLRHIDGFTDLLMRHAEPRLDDKDKGYLLKIGNASKYMGRLIDDLLVFSRMGRMELIATQIDARELVSDTIAELAQDIGNREISWDISDLPIVRGDPAMLRLVLINLISNAIKFTKPVERAEISISGTVTESECTIAVRDNGVGFDPAYTYRLFGVFERLHSQSEFEGTGIGLANVKRIITRHGGRVWAESQPGEGATFYFTLPSMEKGKNGNS